MLFKQKALFVQFSVGIKGHKEFVGQGKDIVLEQFYFLERFGPYRSDAMAHCRGFSIAVEANGNHQHHIDLGTSVVDDVGVPVFGQELVVPFPNRRDIHVFGNGYFDILFHAADLEGAPKLLQKSDIIFAEQPNIGDLVE